MSFSRGASVSLTATVTATSATPLGGVALGFCVSQGHNKLSTELREIISPLTQRQPSGISKNALPLFDNTVEPKLPQKGLGTLSTNLNV